VVGVRDWLLERTAVTDSVEVLADGVAGGRGAVQLVVGEAGLGKTAVLRYGRAVAARAGLRVGYGSGHPMETALPFGLLAQVLEDLGGGGLLADPAAGAAVVDRAARFYGVLRWLEQRAGQRALLVLDDLHWADADSLALFCFICRRIAATGAGVLAAMRPWPAEALQAALGLAQEGCASLQRLVPLSDPAASTLLAARVGRPVADEIGRRAVGLCAGNPLLLEQVAITIGRGDELPEPTGPAAGQIGDGLLLARFAGLPVAGLRCAQAASVLGTRFSLELAAQVAGLTEPDTDVAAECLGRSGLILQHPGGRAGFVHPLFRQALYEDLGGPVRTRLHARAFAVLADRGLEAEAAEHAVQADLAGNQAAVAVLERAGRAARQAGALATAAKRLDAAVVLAGDRAGPELLLAQAETLLAVGRPHLATAVYERVLAQPLLAEQARIEALRMQGRALVLSGAHDRAAARFAEAVSMAQGDDPATAVDVLLDAALASWFTAGPARAVPLASEARKLAASLGQAPRLRAGAAWAFMALQAGDPAGLADGGAQLGADLSFEMADLGGAWSPAYSFAHAAALVERLTEAEQVFSTALSLAERAGAPEAIAVLANGHAFALTRMGRLAEALAAISRALSFADLVPLIESFAGVGYAYIQLYRGQLDSSARWCERVKATATARGEWNALLFLWDVAGHRRLREGAVAEACELYGRLETTMNQMGIGEPCLPPWARHGISAYLAAGRVADAERVLAWLAACAGRLPCRFPRIAEAAGRAQLAELKGDQDQADALFQVALALHDEVDLPLEKVETLLGYGGFLRRSGQPAKARPLLAQAIEMAETAGAAWLAAMASEELKVAGGRRRRRDQRALTAQEQRVADLAAAGLSNAQIARQLYVSASTVETHLEHVYAKLGIHSRHQLMAKAEAGRPLYN
jgi:DNA-binding NarL/FixJ family response regulator